MRGWIIAIGIFVLLVAGIVTYSRLTMRNAAGETTLPPDWPVQGISVPATATDVHFNHDLRQAGDVVKELARRAPKKINTDMPNRFTGPWIAHFNDPGQMNAVFSHFERQLLAAGCTKNVPYGQLPADRPIYDEAYRTADQRYSILVRYTKSAGRAHGSAGRPQHWMVMITELPGR